jgi:hypothetical protein
VIADAIMQAAANASGATARTRTRSSCSLLFAAEAKSLINY